MNAVKKAFSRKSSLTFKQQKQFLLLLPFFSTQKIYREYKYVSNEKEEEKKTKETPYHHHFNFN